MKNKNCYAFEYENCSSKLSNEHIISKSILKLIQSPDKRGHVLGNFKFKTGEKFVANKFIGIGNQMADRILCEKCNNNLSYFDTEMFSFFKIQYSLRYPNSFKNYDGIHTLNGYFLEKWMLKVYLEYAHSIKKNTDKVVSHPPYFFSKEGLEYLFGSKKFMKPNGLYLGSNEDKNSKPSSVSFKIIPKKGLLMEFSGISLFLNISGDEKIDIDKRELKYRPSLLILHTVRKKKNISLDSNINIEWDEKYTENLILTCKMN